MRTQTLRKFLSVSALVFSIVLFTAAAWTQETVVYSFSDPNGDVLPQAGVISDAEGNLYGTTFYGGTYDFGMVYELSWTASGWTETILHSFNVDGVDGFYPTGSLTFDSAGNLYGTTQFGGSGNCSVGFGCGTIFKLSPAGNGTWNETILHEFKGSDGWQVHAGLVFDSNGNLYGATVNGGKFGWGTVFELSPAKNGNWTLRNLHSFSGGMDGGVPYGNVVLDSAGNIYGLTYEGGGVTSACRYGCGTAFELVRGQNGHWTGKVLHNFTTSSGDGQYPFGSLVLDKQGNLYGTASSGGGSSNSGIVFELSPSSSGEWSETVIHNFNDSATDGAGPSAALIFDSTGNLYSTTIGGGSEGRGTVFELSPAGGGTWTETILYSFSSQGSDGYSPNGDLILDKAGNLYGVTASGGQSQDGAVFEVTP